MCVGKFETFLIEWWVARPKRTDSGDFHAFWNKSLCYFEPYCLEFSTGIPSNISVILSGYWEARNSAGLTCRMMLVTGAFESHVVRLHGSTRRTLLWCSIVARSGVNTGKAHVTPRHTVTTVFFIDSTCDDIWHDWTPIFQVTYTQDAIPQQCSSCTFMKPHHVAFKRTCNQHHAASQSCRIADFSVTTQSYTDVARNSGRKF